jgi:ankyrin repeat protein
MGTLWGLPLPILNWCKSCQRIKIQPYGNDVKELNVNIRPSQARVYSCPEKPESVAQSDKVEKIEGDLPSNRPINMDFLIVAGSKVDADGLDLLCGQKSVNGLQIKVGECQNRKEMLEMISKNCNEHTHVFLRAHGWMQDESQDSHEISATKESQADDTGELLQAIRNMKVKDKDGNLVPYKGVIHVASCGVGILENAVTQLKGAGPIILYADNAKLSPYTDSFMIENVVSLLKDRNMLGGGDLNRNVSISEIFKAVENGLGEVGYCCLIETDHITRVRKNRLFDPLLDKEASLSNSAGDQVTVLSRDIVIALQNSIAFCDQTSFKHLLQIPTIRDNINGMFVFDVHGIDTSTSIENPMLRAEVRILNSCVLAKHQEVDLVTTALNYGCNPCERDSRGDTPLLVYCRKSVDHDFLANFKDPMLNVRTLTSRMLEIDKGGESINFKDEDGLSALNYACKASNFEMVKILMCSGARATPLNGSLFVNPEEATEDAPKINAYLFRFYMNALKSDSAVEGSVSERLANFKKVNDGNSTDEEGNTWEMQICARCNSLWEYLEPDIRKTFEVHIAEIMAGADFSHRNNAGQTIADVVIQSNSPVIAQAFLQEHIRRLKNPGSEDEQKAAEMLDEELKSKLIKEPNAWSNFRIRGLFKQLLEFKPEPNMDPSRLDEDLFNALDKWIVSEGTQSNDVANVIFSTSTDSFMKRYIKEWISEPILNSPNILAMVLDAPQGHGKFALIVDTIESTYSTFQADFKKYNSEHKKQEKETADIYSELKIVDQELEEIRTKIDQDSTDSEKKEELTSQLGELKNKKKTLKSDFENSKKLTREKFELRNDAKSALSRSNAAIKKALLQFSETGMNLPYRIIFKEKHEDNIKHIKRLIHINGDKIDDFLVTPVADWMRTEKPAISLEEAVFGKDGFNEQALRVIFEENAEAGSSDYYFIEDFFSPLMKENRVLPGDGGEAKKRIELLHKLCTAIYQNNKESLALQNFARDYLNRVESDLMKDLSRY